MFAYYKSVILVQSCVQVFFKKNHYLYSYRVIPMALIHCFLYNFITLILIQLLFGLISSLRVIHMPLIHSFLENFIFVKFHYHMLILAYFLKTQFLCILCANFIIVCFSFLFISFLLKGQYQCHQLILPQKTSLF